MDANVKMSTVAYTWHTFGSPVVPVVGTSVALSSQNLRTLWASVALIPMRSGSPISPIQPWETEAESN